MKNSTARLYNGMATPLKPLKVGLVLDSGLDEPDGVQQYVLAIGEWLRDKGHEVHYLVGRTERKDIQHLHSLSAAVKVRFNGNNGSIPLFARKQKLRAFLAAEQFDVLHVQVPHHPLLAQRIILEAGPRTAIVGTFHIAPLSKLVTVANKALGIWLRPSLKRFDAMVSVSPAAAAFALETLHIQTPVLPNVIDYQRFHRAKLLPQYDDDVLTILFLGRLVPRKGCQVLLEAVHRLHAEGHDLPKSRVLICGKGPLENRLRQYTAQYGLNDLVNFVGYVTEKDKPKYYASADLTVFPSRGGESFGIVLPEAMASGQAVVLAGDNPGYHSVMSEKPELLFDATNAKALTEKLAYYLTHHAERQQLQAWAATYAKQFDVNAVAPKLLAIYRQALRKRRGA